MVYGAEVETHACPFRPAGGICQPDAEAERDANAEGRGTGGRLVYGGAHGERPWVLKVPCRAKNLLPTGVLGPMLTSLVSCSFEAAGEQGEGLLFALQECLVQENAQLYLIPASFHLTMPQLFCISQEVCLRRVRGGVLCANGRHCEGEEE